MLSCKETSAWANDLIDGVLPWRRRIGLRLHLFLCEHCRRYYRQLSAVAVALRGLPVKRLSDGYLRPRVESLRNP
ncbi:MAG: zf-HC2 domain-containing protein [Gammaproteobacteria bacterium]|nr:zf-HC2 domain-containing protein [Gammaproteobacteria bacterium]